jgi:hypothetical protein
MTLKHMSDDYNPNSVNAVLSRIETKLNDALTPQDEHNRQIGKLWAALGRLDVRVAAIAGGISVVIALVEIFFKH